MPRRHWSPKTLFWPRNCRREGGELRQLPGSTYSRCQLQGVPGSEALGQSAIFDCGTDQAGRLQGHRWTCPGHRLLFA